MAILQADGPAALTVRAVAAAAGCSTTGVYTYFGGKNGLVEAIFVDGFRRFADAVRVDLDTPDPLVALLDAALRYRRWALANRTHYLVMFADAVPGYQPSESAHAESLASFADLARGVELAIRHGQLAGTDATAVAVHLWATLHGYVMLELASRGDPFGDPAARFEAGLNTLLLGLQAPVPNRQ